MRAVPYWLASTALFAVLCADGAKAQICAGGATPCLQGLGFLDSTHRESSAAAISADGAAVVGIARNASNQREGFRWLNGTMQGLGKLPGATGVCAGGTDCSVPNAVSGDGSIVVGTGYVVEGGSQGAARPFVWSGGVMTEIAPPCGVRHPLDRGEALGISANGAAIVGYFSCAAGTNNAQAFRQSGGVTAMLGFLPGHTLSQANGVSADGSVVVGWSSIRGQSATHHAFRWTNSGMTDLGTVSDSPVSAANAISGDASTIVGAHVGTGGGGDNRAVRWGGGRATDFDGFQGGGARAVSADGSVVVLGGDIWTARTGRRGISALLTAYGVDTSQWSNIGSVVGVSSDGRTFAGSGVDINGKGQAWIARLPLPATAHDFDASARSDILWRDSGGTLAMWLMNGASVSTVAVLGSVANNWSVVAGADFNGGGNTDILWRENGGNVAMWLMNGASASQVALLGYVPTSWSVAGVGDFNRDGKADILWRDSSGVLALWLMNGAAASQVIVIGSKPPSWQVAAVADFSGDQRADILLRSDTGSIELWRMNGATVDAVITLGSVDPSWAVAGAGDYDGDGKGDILWRHSSGTLAMWVMAGTGAAQVAVLGHVDPAWTIAGGGDINGDGRSDILWRSSGGGTAVWMMDGVTARSVNLLPSVAPVWAVQRLASN